jgi:fatty-acyl-CoA synthase
MQNCPQFVVALHAVLRLGAVVVPVNPMNKAAELTHCITDAGARMAIASSDIAKELTQASASLPDGQSMQHLLVFDLAEALPTDNGETAKSWPPLWQDWLLTHHPLPTAPGLTVQRLSEALAWQLTPPEVNLSGSDLALLPYTSGTTGAAKGCMHTHATLLHNVMAAAPWLDMRPGDPLLITVPMFHITGLVMGMLATIRHGGKLVLLPRWDRRQAAAAIATQQVAQWPNIPTMVIDLLADPALATFDLSNLRYIGGGGAPMPAPVAAHLKTQFGLDYIEGYGLTETAAPTHLNPMHAPKNQCLGMPFIGTQACIIDPVTLAKLPMGEVGEIAVHGPQVFKGYWNQPKATRDAFLDIDGLPFFRTGDLGRVDEDGYFHMVDRLKRMINASGFKVWPAEVEALLHKHPAIKESCVVAARDAYRGESAKAFVVLRDQAIGTVTEQDIVAWAKDNMSAYKYPRTVEFVNELPRTASGKVLWRKVQDLQDSNTAT